MICGTTPDATEIGGVSNPENSNFPAPDADVPIPTWVIVADPTVHFPNDCVDTGDTELFVAPDPVVTIHPADVLSTGSRAE